MSKNYEMTEEQGMFYRGTLHWILDEYPFEKLNRKFEMSIDMCDLVDWDNEEECGVIFDDTMEGMKQVTLLMKK